MGNRKSSSCKEIYAPPSLPAEVWAHEIFSRLRRLHWPSAIQFRRTCRAFAKIYADWFTPEELCKNSTRDYRVGHLRGREIYAPKEYPDDNYICTYAPFAGPLAICVQSLDRSTCRDEVYFGYAINGNLVLPLLRTEWGLRCAPYPRFNLCSMFIRSLNRSLKMGRDNFAKYIELYLVNPIDIRVSVCSFRFKGSKTFDVLFAHGGPATYKFPSPQCGKEQRGSPVALLTAQALRVLADLARRGKLDWDDCETILYYERVFNPGRFDCAYQMTEMHKYFDAFPDEGSSGPTDDSDTTETLSIEEE